MSKILVIGSQGQLASEIHFLKNQYIDSEFYFSPQSETDISDKPSVERIIEKVKPNFIINCAAYTAVDKAETDSERAFQINEIGVKNLADCSEKNNIFLIHISTDFVFDGKKSTPYQENDSVNPLSVYGMSKLSGEKAIQSTNCDYMIIRTSWLYSSFGNNFVKTMLRLGSEKESINVVSDQIGTPTYCRDLAQFILSNLTQFKSHNQTIYHFSNEGVASWYDFAYEIMRIKQLNCKVNPIPSSEYPTPATRPHFSVMDKSKIKAHYHIHIPHWKDSLSQCIQALQS